MTLRMVSDDERREVSARLRTCTPPASYTSAQGGGWSHLCDMALAVGLTREEDPSAWTLANRLADLIEPTCDRDALLALADEIGRKSNDGTVNPDPMRPLATSLELFGYASRIREACGEVVA